MMNIKLFFEISISSKLDSIINLRHFEILTLSFSKDMTDEESKTGSLLWNPRIHNENDIKLYLLKFYGIYTKTPIDKISK